MTGASSLKDPVYVPPLPFYTFLESTSIILSSGPQFSSLLLAIFLASSVQFSFYCVLLHSLILPQNDWLFSCSSIRIHVFPIMASLPFTDIKNPNSLDCVSVFDLLFLNCSATIMALN